MTQTDLALLQQKVSITEEHLQKVLDRLDDINDSLHHIGRMADDYYGDEKTDRLGTAKMARRAYACVKWILTIGGLGAVGGTTATAAVNPQVLEKLLP